MKKPVLVLMCLIIGALFVSVSTRLSASSEPEAFAQDDVRLFRINVGRATVGKRRLIIFRARLLKSGRL